MKILISLFILFIGFMDVLNAADSIKWIDGARFCDGKRRLEYNHPILLPNEDEIRKHFAGFFSGANDTAKLLSANNVVSKIANKKLSIQQIYHLLKDQHNPSVSGLTSRILQFDERLYDAANFLIEMIVAGIDSSK